MKRWPLRWKVALYAATLAVVATLAGATTTWIFMRQAEVAAFDRRLELDAREFFREIENFAGGPANNRTSIKRILVPLALRDRLVEVRAADGEVLYRSPTLRESISDDGIREFHTREIDGQSVRMGEFSENGLKLRVGSDLREINQVGWDIVYGMFAAIPTVLVVIFLGARWVARQALAPVEAIRQAAASISLQSLDQRLPVPPAADEIAGLIAVLNATFDRLQRSFEQSKRFTTDASHQLKTPIAVLRAGIEEILTDSNTPPAQAVRADALLHQVHQLTSIAENLLLLARADAGRLDLKPEEFDMCSVLEGVLDDVRALAEPRGLAVEADLPDRLPLFADRSSMALITQNLMENAVKYNAPGGCVRVSAQTENGWMEVTVANHGEPIPTEQAPHVFERFYRARSDAATSGHGLGLSIARELAAAHGGEIKLVRSDSEWTEFKLRVPQKTMEAGEEVRATGPRR